MMKTPLTLCVLMAILCLSNTIVVGQPESLNLSYGHEWMVDDATYVYIEVDQKGIYKISHHELINLGVQTESLHGGRLRLYNQGTEIPIYVSSDDLFQEGDYIMFYGKPSDGSLDALLYEDPEKQQLNPRYSLYDDTRTYFLSWEPKSNTPLRYHFIENNETGDRLPPIERFYIHHKSIEYHDFHFKPTHDGRNFVRYSSMDDGEGFGSRLSEITSMCVDLDHHTLPSIDPVVLLRFGTNVNSRNWQIDIEGIKQLNISQPGYGVVDIKESIDLDNNFDGCLNVSIRPLNSLEGKHSLSYVEIQYPRSFNFDGENSYEFFLQPSIIPRTLEISDFGTSDKSLLFNLDRQTIMESSRNQDLWRFVSDASFAKEQMILIDDELGYQEPIHMDLFKSNFSSVQSSDYLIITHRLLENAAKEYASYRASEEGGSFETALIFVEDLYHQFGYGKKGHPIAIRNYLRYLKDGNNLPSFIFLIGKGAEYAHVRSGADIANLVPTFGVPGSDNLLVAFDGNNYPEVPIGRLAATNPSEVHNYLDKVRLHENPIQEEQTLESQKWKKTIVHLSGGSADIQEVIFGYLQDMESVISNNRFGADVMTFRKTSADPIQSSRSQEIIDQINEGASVVSFFGHSAVGTFDFSLEDPSKYANKGKNPVILSLGCHSGNLHTPNRGISEEFTLQEDMGSIAFIASSGTAFITPQFHTGLSIYQLLGDEMYGERLGEILQKSLQSRSDETSLALQTLIQQLTLHGDPAYRFNAFKGPDFVVDDESVHINPTVVNSVHTSFSLTFDVVNIGATVEGPLQVKVSHQLPNGSIGNEELIIIPAPSFKSTINIDLDHPGFDAIGQNKILIEIDPNELIQERPADAAEINNDLINVNGEGYEFFIFGNGAKPTHPSPFCIVNKTEDFVLRSSLDNAFTVGAKFAIEIDTTELFNSPAKQRTEIQSTSSGLEWAPPLGPTNEQVYYWRIGLVTADGSVNPNTWRPSSFVYLEGSEPGWNQSHFYQWQKDEFNKIYLNPNRQFSYGDRVWDVRIKNELLDLNDYWVYINNSPWASLNAKQYAPAIAIFIWDSDNVLFQNSGSDFGSMPFSPDLFLYKMEDMKDRENIKLLLDKVPHGSRVFMHTILKDEESDLDPQSWLDDKSELGYDLFEVLEGYGATKARNLLDLGTVPYTFVFDKGIGPVVEDIATRIEETLDLSTTARSIWNEGYVRSVPIGPVDRWKRLLWSESKEANDETRLKVIGVDPYGNEVLLKEIQDDYSVNLTSINPAKYPALILQYETKDIQSKTSAQLNHWRILSTELPDAKLESSDISALVSDTIHSGEDLHIEYTLSNPSSKNLESVLVKYKLQSPDGESRTQLKRIDPVAGNERVKIDHIMSTDGLGGRYFLSIEVNPNQEVEESSFCNNFGLSELYIKEDNRNPILQVTFDGKMLENGAIVSENPSIIISLSDFDSRVLMDDPGLFDVRLLYPQVLERTIHDSDPDVTFMPATDLDNNIAQIIFKPTLSEHGTYTLQVRAEDPAGNPSGDQVYQVTFEVQNIPQKTFFHFLPNPMTDRAILEFNMDSEINPSLFDLFIYHADGRLVRTLDMADLNPQRGLNVYQFDATEQDGSPLINGVYFYKLITNLSEFSEVDTGRFMVLRKG